MTVGRDPGDTLENAIDDNERGLKDTIRVNPNEIVEIAVRFTTYSGRYMYLFEIASTNHVIELSSPMVPHSDPAAGDVGSARVMP
jgi:hypothetical protein